MQSKGERKIKNYKTFMVLIHIFAATVYPFTRTKLCNSFYSLNSLFFYFIYVLWGTACEEFSNCCRNPGYAKPTDDPINNSGQNQPETHDDHPLETPEDDIQKTKDGKYFYCNICKMYVPLRTCHCRQCGKCIIRRDHHCPFTNQCIGRDNHCIFLIWTYLETILMMIVLYDLISSLFHYNDFAKNPIKSISVISSESDYLPKFKYYSSLFLKWLNLFKVNLFLIPFAAFGFFECFLLAFQHTAMAATNVTTWEIVRRSSITYLNQYPVTFNPFNKGVFNNFKEFILMQSKKTLWNDLPAPTLNDFVTENHMFSNEFFDSLISTYSTLGVA